MSGWDPFSSGTNGWDVLSDAIKIGVPSLITGLVAYRIAKASRSHDFEKGRRQRRQDLLQEVADRYGDFRVKLESAFAITLSWNDSQSVSSGAREILGKDLIRIRNETNEAQLQLNRFQSKLRISGFHECARKLQEFDLDASGFKGLLTPQEDMHSTLRGPFLALIAKGQEFETLLEQHYAQL